MELLKLLVPALGSIVVAIIGAQWFSPEVLRLDIWFPSNEVKILDDFVFVHFEYYEERDGGTPQETYHDLHSGKNVDVYDKATYVEHVSIRRTKAKYQIRLGSSGVFPEIIAISPPLRNVRYEITPGGGQILTAELDVEQSPEFFESGLTSNPKTIYTYRNGFQGNDSSGGKNVAYDTEKLTFVYDFSKLPNWERLFRATPKVCLKREEEDNPSQLGVKWQDGVAIAEASNLKKGDRVRIFWTWSKRKQGDPENSLVTCNQALN